MPIMLKNIYHQVGNFFIGIAPIFGGLLVIMALMGLLLPQVLESLMGCNDPGYGCGNPEHGLICRGIYGRIGNC